MSELSLFNIFLKYVQGTVPILPILHYHKNKFAFSNHNITNENVLNLFKNLDENA